MRKRQYHCPFEVVVRWPGNSDESLAAAWRFVSDQTIRDEIARELETIELLQQWKPVNLSVVNTKKVRVHKMQRVQDMRSQK